MRKKQVQFFFMVFVVSGIIFMNTTRSYDRVRKVVLDVTAPVFTVSHQVFYMLLNGIAKSKDIISVYQERDSLRAQLVEARTMLIQLDELKQENIRLRKLLKFKQDSIDLKLTAEVIGRDMSPFSDSLVINRGKLSGVAVGTVLLNHAGLIGHVVSVGESHARAMLISDIKNRVCVIVQNTREAGILEGTPTSLLKLRHLHLNTLVKVGDTVITSGFGEIYPKGIPIGKIEVIATEKDNVSVYALIRPFVDFATVEEVLCLQKE